MARAPDTRFHFRQAQASDIDDINQIALRSKAYWKYPPHLLQIFEGELRRTAAELNDQHTYSGVALTNSANEREIICGFFTVQRSYKSREGELEALFIDPDYIRQGLGSILLKQACEIASQWRLRSLRVESDPNAEPFYVAMGAVRTGSQQSSLVPNRKLPVLRLPITVSSRS